MSPVCFSSSYTRFIPVSITSFPHALRPPTNTTRLPFLVASSSRSIRLSPRILFTSTWYSSWQQLPRNPSSPPFSLLLPNSHTRIGNALHAALKSISRLVSLLVARCEPAFLTTDRDPTKPPQIRLVPPQAPTNTLSFCRQRWINGHADTPGHIGGSQEHGLGRAIKRPPVSSPADGRPSHAHGCHHLASRLCLLR